MIRGDTLHVRFSWAFDESTARSIDFLTTFFQLFKHTIGGVMNFLKKRQISSEIQNCRTDQLHHFFLIVKLLCSLVLIHYWRNLSGYFADYMVRRIILCCWYNTRHRCIDFWRTMTKISISHRGTFVFPYLISMSSFVYFNAFTVFFICKKYKESTWRYNIP